MTITHAAASPVPFAPPAIGAGEIAEVFATLESGWLTTGPRVAAFERAFADHVGAPHAIAVCALHLQPFCQERFGLTRGMFPVAEMVFDTTLSLPMSPVMTDGTIHRVIEAIHDVLR